MKPTKITLCSLPALLLGLLCLTWGATAAAQSDLRQDGSNNASAKPIVLVLLDTSGSMEYLQDEGEFPDCSQNPIPSAGKPRQAIAKEVLAGRIEDLTCAKTARPNIFPAYPLDHFDLQSNYGPLRRRRETGLLHINRELVRFGFMSFDSDEAGGDSASYVSNPGVPGDESTTWNLGIRSPNAAYAPLIDIGDLDKPSDGLRRAASIEDAVVSFVPYGPTPLAAMFRDLKKYLETQSLDGYELGDDEFALCRNIEIVLVTDGEPTYDDCAPGQPSALLPRCANYPYRTTLQELAELVTTANVDHQIRVHVVGFNTTSDAPCRGASGISINGESPPAASCIHQMAMVGGTDSNNNPNDDVFAYVADNQVDLTRQLTRVLANIVSGISARTKSATTSRTSFRGDRSGRYQFGAAFEISADSHLWHGILERTTYSCIGGTRSRTIVDFSQALDTPSTRQILSPILNPARSGHPEDSSWLSRNGSELIKINDTLSSLNGTISTTDLNRSFSGGVFDNVEFQEVVAILEGRGVRSGRAMGGVFHSNPVISGGPELSLDIPGYERFSAAFSTRKTTVFVGAGDGQLHAFDAEVTDDNVGQAHMWSYLPQELQKSAYLQHATRIAGVDGSPLVRDVRLFRGSGSPGDVVDPVGNAVTDNVGFYDIWSTVLVSGVRGGGRTFFALDVSEPRSPRFLWELNPTTEQRRLDNRKPNELTVAEDRALNAPLIGLSYGQPAIGTVLMKSGDDNIERAIAILPGGFPEDPNATSPPEAVQQGRVLYVVDLPTGRILRRFTRYYDPDAGAVRDIDAAIVGDVGAFDDYPGNLITRAFMGDAAGRLLRLDLRDPEPANWSLSIFHDSGSDNPIFFKPSMAFNQQNEVVVLYGTGDVDNLGLREGVNSIFSLREKQNINLLTGAISGVEAVLNWRYDFSNSEKLTGAPLVYNSVAYFPTFVPNSAACAFGYGRIYAVDFDGDPTLDDEENGNYTTDDVYGKFDPNDDNFNDPNLDLDLNNNNLYFSLPDNAIVFGLEIAQQPACTPDIPENFGQPGVNPGGVDQNALNPPLELIAQTGQGNANRGGPPTGSSIRRINFQLQRPPSSVFPLSWSAVLD